MLKHQNTLIACALILLPFIVRGVEPPHPASNHVAALENLAAQSPTLWSWVTNLEAPGPGEWKFLSTDTKGEEVTFFSPHNATWDGSIRTVWMRSEFHYVESEELGLVQRMQFDCAHLKTRALTGTYFSGRNMSGIQRDLGINETTAKWGPAIPGSQAELWLSYFCAAWKSGAPKPTPPTH